MYFGENMRLFFLVIAVGIFLISCFYTLLFYPVSFHFSYDEEKKLSVRVSFLFFRTRIAGPLTKEEVRLSDRAFRRRIRRLRKRRSAMKDHGSFRNEGAEAFSEKAQSVRLVLLALKTLQTEEFPRLRLVIQRLIISVGGDAPDQVAILTGTILALVSFVQEFLSTFAYTAIAKDASVTVIPSFLSEKIKISFDLSLSLPLLYYLEVFGFRFPDRRRMLLCLQRRQEKQLRRRSAARNKKEHVHVGE